LTVLHLRRQDRRRPSRASRALAAALLTLAIALCLPGAASAAPAIGIGEQSADLFSNPH